LMRPRDLAKLIMNLAPQANERALEIAGATGYGAAVLAACCKEVITLDPNPDLSFAAQSALESVGVTNAKTVSTTAVDGWKDEAPYDVILLNGSAEIVPDAARRASTQRAAMPAHTAAPSTQRRQLRRASRSRRRLRSENATT
jgi:protein-L-isoaspartate(D-aspartate) O-methyltransferase